MPAFSIRTKVLASGFLTLALTLAVSATAMWALGVYSRASEDTYVMVQALNNHQTADMMHDALRGDALRALVVSEGRATTPQVQREIMEELDAHRQLFLTSLESNTKLPLPSAVRGKLDAIRPRVLSYIEATSAFVTSAFRDRAGALAQRDAVQQAFTDLEGPMGDLSVLIEKACDDERAHSAANGAAARRALLISAGLGSLLALALAFGLSRSIVAPLALLESGLTQIAGADADLRSRLELGREDELGNAASAFNKFVESLEGVIGQLKQGVVEVAHTSQRLAKSSASIAQRTERQAAALEETSASVTHFSSGLSDTAARCQGAGVLAKDVQDAAKAAQRAVQQLVTRMQKLQQNARKIQDIIGVVDEISLQTNLLALNATVEAARAGEQGRGFSVVAGEVRNLALRSADSAREIRVLLKSSNADAEAGAEEAAASGVAMNDIVGRVDRVATLLEETSAATQDQANGVEEVRSAVADMDSATQQSAILNQECSDAAEHLAQQARQLAELAGRFRTNGGDGTDALEAETRARRRQKTPPPRTARPRHGLEKAGAERLT
jgi:methyl-accepting chemotaxis protein